MTIKRNSCPINKIVPKRERMMDGKVNVLSTRPYMQLDFLTLYTPHGLVLARSLGHGSEEDIVLNYRGLNLICSPGYKDAIVVIEWFSLMNWANDCYEDDEILTELLEDDTNIENVLIEMEEEHEDGYGG